MKKLLWSWQNCWKDLVYFDNFFNSPTLVKLFEKKIYAIGAKDQTENKCQRWQLINKWSKKTESFSFQTKGWHASRWLINLFYSSQLHLKVWIICQQFNNEKKAAKNLQSFVQSLSNCTTSGWEASISWTKERHCIDWVVSLLFLFKSSCSFLWIFYDLMDIAGVSSYILYNMRNPNKLTLLDFEIVVAKNLIQWHQGQQRAVLSSRISKRKIQSNSSNWDDSHLPHFQQTRKRCVYCASNGKENRKYKTCMPCEAPLCLLKVQKHPEFLCTQKLET